MKKICTICEAEYEDHAVYCNVCKQESLVALVEPQVERKSERLIADGPTLAYVSIAWILGIGYMIGQLRPRSWITLLIGWGMLTLVTTVYCIVMRNPRMAAIMSLCGLSFFLVYGFLFL